MSELARVAFRFRFLALLRASLVAGAVYDLGFAALMVVAPRWLGTTFALPLPGEAFYLHLLALLLTMLAALYLLAARDPRRYSGVVAVAAAGRLGGAVVFSLAALADPALGGLWPVAAADAAFGVAHAGFWWPLH